MSDAPRLSVVMPMRNCAHCVCDMLDSLLRQNIPMQIVIVDDVSEDGGPARVAAWSQRTGQPVELLHNNRRLYSYGSRLKGLASAVAPAVWCVDADDVIPENARVRAALDVMEREKPDILHCRACGVTPGSRLQRPLDWTEPVADRLSGSGVFSAFLARAYPPVLLWNKFFSARLVRAVLEMAPDVEVRYFDVKFLGMLFSLAAQRYVACNEPVYEYRMRAHRPAWLYARQVNALLLLERELAPLVTARAPDQAEAFRAYCRRRQNIQTGHLSLMAEAELADLKKEEGRRAEEDSPLWPNVWLDRRILPNIGVADLRRALCRSLGSNAARLEGWTDTLARLHGDGHTRQPVCDTLPRTLDDLSQAARQWLYGDGTPPVRQRLARYALRLGRNLAASGQAGNLCADLAEEQCIALLLGNAQLARTVTGIMAPGIDITQKAN